LVSKLSWNLDEPVCVCLRAGSVFVCDPRGSDSHEWKSP